MRSDFKTELEKNGRLIYINKGTSMLPLLRENRDVMVLRKACPPFEKRDTVLYVRDNGQYVVHRIARVLSANRYYIIGDNCLKGETVREDQIIGILTRIHRGKREIRVTDPLYRIYAALVPCRRTVRKAYLAARRKCGRLPGQTGRKG